MKNLIKSRRGIAIELAIGAMLIMMALSIVLVSISGMQNRHKESDLEAFANKVEVYEITDYILKNHTAEQPVTAEQLVTAIGYEYTVVCEELAIGNYAYTISKTDSVILTLEIKTVTDDDANVTTNTITSWRD